MGAAVGEEEIEANPTLKASTALQACQVQREVCRGRVELGSKLSNSTILLHCAFPDQHQAGEVGGGAGHLFHFRRGALPNLLLYLDERPNSGTFFR